MPCSYGSVTAASTALMQANGAAGKNADQHLRQTDFCRLLGDAVVAGHCGLEPAAQRETVDRSHDRLAALLQHVDRTLTDAEAFCALAELADVGAGDEAAACA